jgi:hypothetical protein
MKGVTMNTILSHKRLRWVSLGLVLAALAAPPAQSKTGGQAAIVSRSGASTAYRSDDRLGPKFVLVANGRPVGNAAPAITIVKPAGFDTGDALIGAGVAAVATALLAALFVLSGRFKGHRSTNCVAVRMGRPQR